jgi:GNAT superfamily N-acetyltransferase
VVRRTEAYEWEKLRGLRLQALAETPEAFAATLAESMARTDEEWRERFAPGPDRVSVAEVDEDGRFVGMVSGFVARDVPDVAYLAGMFVIPERRGRGIGRRLVAEVEAWAVELGLRRLELDVNPELHAAAQLYEGCGFRRTGRSHAFPDRPEITVVQLAKDL